VNSIALAGGLVLALLAFFGWKEGLVRHGWYEHNRCIEARRFDMPLDEAVAGCASAKAFKQWRNAVSNAESVESEY
jgi:hypothetical protein